VRLLANCYTPFTFTFTFAFRIASRRAVCYVHDDDDDDDGDDCWMSVCRAVQDVLENEEIKLDSVFKFSLIQDLVRVRSSPLCLISSTTLTLSSDLNVSYMFI